MGVSYPVHVSIPLSTCRDTLLLKSEVNQGGEGSGDSIASTTYVTPE